MSKVARTVLWGLTLPGKAINMKKKAIIITIWLLVFSNYLVTGQEQELSIKDEALKIVKENLQSIDTIEQLIVVFNEKQDEHEAILVALQKGKKGWEIKFDSIPAGIGYNGFAKQGEKREGDGKSPTGLFSLGQLFCYENNVNTKMPYQLTTEEDKWIDDPNSEDYNKHIRGDTKAKSFEYLKLRSDAYKFCMVIEYNTCPVIKGMGSAIFFHLGKEFESTAGCVAITEPNMLLVLKWLSPKCNPSIIMGNKKELQEGLK